LLESDIGIRSKPHPLRVCRSPSFTVYSLISYSRWICCLLETTNQRKLS